MKGSLPSFPLRTAVLEVFKEAVCLCIYLYAAIIKLRKYHFRIFPTIEQNERLLSLIGCSFTGKIIKR